MDKIETGAREHSNSLNPVIHSFTQSPVWREGHTNKASGDPLYNAILDVPAAKLNRDYLNLKNNVELSFRPSVNIAI